VEAKPEPEGLALDRAMGKRYNEKKARRVNRESRKTNHRLKFLILIPLPDFLPRILFLFLSSPSSSA
jgi:hypothetical protein